MRIFLDLQPTTKRQIVATTLLILISSLGMLAQTARQRGSAANDLGPAPSGLGGATGAGMGAATGSGLGAANGRGIGAATGHGVGMASGTSVGMGSTMNVIRPPSATTVFKVRNKRAAASDLKLGTAIGINAGRGVAPAEETTSGVGEATGNGTANETSPGQEKPEPKQDYIKEIDGKCFYVTNLGEKRYVSSSKCEIN